MKKVCFVSLSRSDYTSLRYIIKESQRKGLFIPHIVAGGSHLLERFGNSIDAFEKDGIKVDHILDFLSEDDDSNIDFAKAYAKAYSQFLEYLITEKPNAVFILGDRWEMLAMVAAATLVRIPILHHSGGDLTQGSLDNQTRYTISMQSHYHFVALEDHKKRLLLMGEEGWRVVTTGEPALSEIHKYQVISKDIYERLGLDDKSDFVLATFHPTTFDKKNLEEQIDFFLESLKLIDMDIVLTAPNPDPGSKSFFTKINDYAKSNSRVHLFENLGAENYYSAMARASFMIGNSSSGIWEAPSFQLPVINIGERQAGRTRSGNVIDVSFDIKEVEASITRAKSTKFKNKIINIMNPYFRDKCSEVIVDGVVDALRCDHLLSKKLIDPLVNRISL